MTIERLDADPECDPLVPAGAPAPVEAHIDTPNVRCGGGLSEGGGYVAVQMLTTSDAPSTWQFFAADGRAEQRVALAPNTVVAQPDLVAQPDGWQGAVPSAPSGPVTVDVRAFLGDGSLRRTETLAPGFVTFPWTWFFAGDPQGGSLLVLTGVSTPPPDGPCNGEARRYDASGAPRDGSGQVRCGVVAAGVSNQGEALVISGVRGPSLQWLAQDGTPARPVSTDDGAGPLMFADSGVTLVPLLDGSLVVYDKNDGSWRRRYPHLAPSGEAAPSWLEGRTGQTLRFTRGNRGYALFPGPGESSADCTQSAELLGPSGRRCVRLTFREDARDCTLGFVDQGWDGTVVQQSGKDPCRYRWWPKLLAGP